MYQLIALDKSSDDNTLNLEFDLEDFCKVNLDFSIVDKALRLNLEGDFIGYDNPELLHKLQEALLRADVKTLSIDAKNLQKWDSTLVVILFELIKLAGEKKKDVRQLNWPQNLSKLLNLAFSVDRKPERPKQTNEGFLEEVGSFTLDVWASIQKGMNFIGQVLRSLGRLVGGQAVMRRVDWLFALEDCSYKAVGIVSLISFMVGLILAFVGAIQLKNFGAQIYVASLVAIGMTRIMGAIMVGVVMAGRTGASYAATIGTMQVNEEIDALKTMGIPVTDFLVLPRITALTLTMPLLVILADFMGVIGGASVGIGMLGISPEEYWNYTLKALDMDNFLVGLFHGLVFGIIISICGCYFGIYCGRNADSVGKATTQAVVSAIVWMIVATGIITWIFEVLGI